MRDSGPVHVVDKTQLNEIGDVAAKKVLIKGRNAAPWISNMSRHEHSNYLTLFLTIISELLTPIDIIVAHFASLCEIIGAGSQRLFCESR